MTVNLANQTIGLYEQGEGSGIWTSIEVDDEFARKIMGYN